MSYQDLTNLSHEVRRRRRGRKDYDMWAWTGFNWLSITYKFGLMWTRQ
jgi:hypothetical protein